MTFEEVYIFKDDEGEILGQISFDEPLDKWVFMPSGKPFFMEDIANIKAKLDELYSESEGSSMISIFKK